MNKIASPQDLQAELRSLVAFVHAYGPDGKPDRQVIAAKLRDLADRVAGSHWTSIGKGLWGVDAEYADGTKHNWHIKQDGEQFDVSVKTSDGVFHAKKKFDDLKSAQKFGDRYITKANGHETLQKALSRDFKKA